MRAAGYFINQGSPSSDFSKLGCFTPAERRALLAELLLTEDHSLTRLMEASTRGMKWSAGELASCTAKKACKRSEGQPLIKLCCRVVSLMTRHSIILPRKQRAGQQTSRKTADE